MKKIIIILMLAMFAFSCRTTRTVVGTTLKIDSTEIMNLNVKTESTGIIDNLKTNTDKSVITNELTENVIETTWTAPDSSGKQYIIKKTVTTRSQNAKKTSDVVNTEQSNQESESTKSVIDKSRHVIQSQATTVKKDTVKVKTPKVVTWATIIPVVVLLIFVYLFLKKRKII